MLARWYLLLGQFSVTFEYRPGSQHSNADGMSRQCGQCRRPDSLVSADTRSLLVDQPFASSEMGDSMDSDLLPELSGETWVASALLEELTVDLPMSESDIDLVAASRKDKILQTVRSWVQSGNAPPWPACAGLSPELRCWRLQVGNPMDIGLPKQQPDSPESITSIWVRDALEVAYEQVRQHSGQVV